MAVFQWPHVWGPRRWRQGRIPVTVTPSPATACGAALLGAGLPKAAACAAAMGPDPHRLANLQCRRANRQRWLRAGSLVLGSGSACWRHSHSTKWIQHTRAVVVNCTIVLHGAANGAI